MNEITYSIAVLAMVTGVASFTAVVAAVLHQGSERKKATRLVNEAVKRLTGKLDVSEKVLLDERITGFETPILEPTVRPRAFPSSLREVQDLQLAFLYGAQEGSGIGAVSLDVISLDAGLRQKVMGGLRLLQEIEKPFRLARETSPEELERALMSLQYVHDVKEARWSEREGGLILGVSVDPQRTPEPETLRQDLADTLGWPWVPGRVYLA